MSISNITWNNVLDQSWCQEPETNAAEKIARMADHYQHPSTAKATAYLVSGIPLVLIGTFSMLLLIAMAAHGGGMIVGLEEIPLFIALGGGLLIHNGWKKIEDPILVKEDIENRNVYLAALITKHNAEIQEKLAPIKIQSTSTKN